MAEEAAAPEAVEVVAEVVAPEPNLQGSELAEAQKEATSEEEIGRAHL